MAPNPVTGIDFDTDRFVVRKNGVITHFDKAWPRLDGGPVSGGFAAGEEWFKKEGPADRTVYDHRYAVDGAWNCIPTDPPAGVGWPTGVYRETLTANLRPAEELKQQVDAAMQDANRAIQPEAIDPSFTTRALRASTRKQDGTATPEDLALLAAIETAADLMQQNEERRQELYGDIDAGREWDITDGWQRGPIPA